MKLRCTLAVLLACCIGMGGCGPPAGETQARRLRFEHIGPEDASIPPFVVEVGRVAEATNAVVFVTPEAYADVFALVKQGGASPPRSPRPQGTFRVTAFKGEEATETFTIYPETVLSIIDRLRRMFQSEGAHMPEALSTLETLLTPREQRVG